MSIEFAIDDLLCSSHDCLGDLWVKQSQCFVCLCRSLLDLSKSAKKLAWKAQITNRKVQYSSLCARAIIGIYGNAHLTHCVAFDAGLFYVGHGESSIYSIGRIGGQ